MSDLIPSSTEYKALPNDIVRLVDNSRRFVTRSVNSVMAETYWERGRRIVDLEKVGRIVRLAEDLSTRLRRGLGRQNLWLMP